MGDRFQGCARVMWDVKVFRASIFGGALLRNDGGEWCESRRVGSLEFRVD